MISSVFFDIEEISDVSNELPHMLPSQTDFISHMKQLQIRKDDLIICYDNIGFYTAPRVWYL
jgi:thiosulfate/3-mercaptopyruvate sulfurtransferase